MLTVLNFFKFLNRATQGICSKMLMLEIKKSEMATVTGGTSTTLMLEVGFAGTVTENEYWDCDGDGKLSEPDVFVKEIEIEIPPCN